MINRPIEGAYQAWFIISKHNGRAGVFKKPKGGYGVQLEMKIEKKRINFEK